MNANVGGAGVGGGRVVPQTEIGPVAEMAEEPRSELGCPEVIGDRGDHKGFHVSSV